MRGYLGVDVGSVSTNIVVLDEDLEVREALYLRTRGQPIKTIVSGLKELIHRGPDLQILGVGATGSGRNLADMVIGSDVVKNEITAHSVAAMHINPEVRTVIEIGGQDSKIIVIRDGVVVDFAMNSVCAAGTGSFLDQQAARLNLSIEEFAALALESSTACRIAGRCSVFAESDMIHKQQAGHSMADIISGLNEALVRNYLNNVGKGKDIQPPIMFQGGVAANIGLRRAFSDNLGVEVSVPEHFSVMGAIGAAVLASEEIALGLRTRFKGFGLTNSEYRTGSFECSHCSNLCEVVEFRVDGQVKARWGGRCARWEIKDAEQAQVEDNVAAGVGSD